MSSIDFEVNEQVVGKTKAVSGQLGIIKTIEGVGKKRKYQVLFADNVSRSVTIRSIAKVLKYSGPLNNNQETDALDDPKSDLDVNEDDDKSSSQSTEASSDELNTGFIRYIP